MKIELVDTMEKFEQIQKGDLILVKWSDNWVRHMPKAKSIMSYTVYENKTSDKELICQKKNNHYFNYEMYLKGTSSALEIYKVTDS